MRLKIDECGDSPSCDGEKGTMADTLLAHLIPRFPVQSEPIATQALAYVLNTVPDVSKAFVSVVRQTGFGAVR